MYAHSNELDEVGVISLSDSSVKVEHNAEMDALFDVSAPFLPFGTLLINTVTAQVHVHIVHPF